ncbi:MAG: 30S ribosomal protein S7 [Chloroflexi bacterium]|nr:30S ribosomal protein S7 [Chloroflexota bacterium]MDL1883475.1 30S ribosomal protein S7 [Anaerolineae bacterium CFX8]GIL14791.1 MAG: 30S ribosomal protein S7 [Chloroflexota bacterium]
MPRRYRPTRRPVMPDQKYNNVLLAMLINRMMYGGKKSTAQQLAYKALDLIEERAKRDPIEVFEQALRNVTPAVEVKPMRVGGSTYQVPVEVPTYRAQTLAMRWILENARNRGGRNMAEKLAAELMDAASGQGASIKKKDDTHRMAEANRAFAHFR